MFQTRVFEIWWLIREVMKNIKFQVIICKIMPARPKNTGTWVVNPE